MTNQLESILTAGVTVALGIVGVAFLTALVNNQSQSPDVISSLTGGFACTLRTAITGKNACGSATSSITFCPPGKSFTSTGCK